MPRSIMADIIYKNEDDLVKRRHRAAALIELPSGAWQKRPVGSVTSACEPSAKAASTATSTAATAAPLAARMGLRQRKGRTEEGRTGEHMEQHRKLEVRRNCFYLFNYCVI